MMPTLPLVTVIAIVCACLAVILFVAGYIKGFSASIASVESDASNDASDRSRGFGWAVSLAVIAAAVVIVLLGVNPLFISLAPFLSILSAAVIGALFFIEARMDRGN